MNLVLDIGNSRVKLGIFQGSELLHREVWSKLSLEALQALAYNHPIRHALLSSTAKVPSTWMAFLEINFGCFELTHQTPLPIRLQYRTPETLGRDRIAGAAGAFHHFPEENCLIIDAGTCITYDFLTAAGTFLGGNIAPGVDMRLRAMHDFTAKLPFVKRLSSKEWQAGSTIPVDFLGNDTENALRLGAEMGAIFEAQGYHELAEKQFGVVKVILTGGDADLFGSAFKTKIFARPNLVLEGLNKILQYNVERKEIEF